MKLIVGLGNPGREYEKTRHNLGFSIIDEIAKEKNVTLNKKKFNGLYGEFHEEEKIILLKPQSYVNNSGKVVANFVDYFNLDLKDLLIIYDDYYLEVGSYKIKASGSSAGHNGLKSIEKYLGTQEYQRIKVGISRDMQMLLPDYVLSKFNKEEQKKVEKVKKEIVGFIDNFWKKEFSDFMSQYSQKKVVD